MQIEMNFAVDAKQGCSQTEMDHQYQQPAVFCIGYNIQRLSQKVRLLLLNGQLGRLTSCKRFFLAQVSPGFSFHSNIAANYIPLSGSGSERFRFRTLLTPVESPLSCVLPAAPET